MASKRRTCRKRAPRNHEKLLTVSIEDPYKGKKKNKDRVVSYNLSFIDTPPKGYDKEAGVLTIDVNKKINGKLYNVIRYADLDDSLKGKGYGKLLYETALFHLGTITTHITSHLAMQSAYGSRYIEDIRARKIFSNKY